MKTRMLRIALVNATAVAVALLGTGVVWAADSPTTAGSASKPPVSKETREKMAVIHEQMAACLRSDKTLSECHAEMMKSCHDNVGVHGCPMMGHGHGKDGGGMRQKPMKGADSGS